MDKRTVCRSVRRLLFEYSVSGSAQAGWCSIWIRKRLPLCFVDDCFWRTQLAPYTGRTRMWRKIRNDPRWCAHLRSYRSTAVINAAGAQKQVERVHLDAAFPCAHGKMGKTARCRRTGSIPLVGCGVLASALCMDKDRAHKLAAVAG